MKNRSVTPMWIAKAGYIVLSLVYCGVGVLFLARPDFSVRLLGRTLGAAMAAFGAIKLVGYFSRDLFRLAFQYDLEFGILLLALGAAVLLRPNGALDFLFAALGVAALADGLFKVRIALDARRFGIRSWWLTMALAAVTCVAGGLLALRPWVSARLLTELLGASLLAEGGLNLCVALSTVKIIKHQRPDVIEADCWEVRQEPPIITKKG